ncbi:unnamed protein product [Caenorhabditis brenneri]
MIFLLDQLIATADYFKKQKSGVIAEEVFKNPYLAEKIVRNLDVKSYLAVRTVNKSFNNACLGVLRKDNRRMKMEFLQCVHDESRVINDFFIHINLTPFLLKDTAYWFRFLNKVAGVQVEQIEVRHLWKLRLNPSNAHWARKFHKDIHSKLIGSNQNSVKSLIGLENVSSTCTECQKIFRTCSEYGPIDMFWTKNDFGGKHFERIVLTDVFLDECANSCAWDTQSKELCYKRLEDRFSQTNISCETLTICIHEYRDTDKSGENKNHTPIPLEVLEMVLEKWNVQKIELKILCNWRRMPYMDTWSESNYFTGIRFIDQVPDLKLPRKFSHIKVDLSESLLCSRELKLEKFMTGYPGYENLIANIRKLFGSDKISINFTHWLFYKPSDPQEVLENFLRISRLGFHQNLTIDVELYLKIDEILTISKRFEALGPLSPSLRSAQRKDEIYFFYTQKWVGERFRFVDSVKNFTLNTDVFVREENLKEVTAEHLEITMFMGMFQLERF